jgi:UDP-N-acetylglucosamine 3-dehydrogenase
VTLGAAVVGVGAMGRHHARVYRELEATVLCGVADPDVANARFVAQRHGVPAYADHRELLAAQHPDIVSVAVPTAAHLEVVRDCLAAGAHVLVEKPIAASMDEGRDMLALSRSAGRTLTVGHVERFNPAVIELRRRLQEGALGRVFEIRSRRMGPFPARVRDVGVVVDLAAHDLDIMRWLVGEVARVYAETARRIHTEHEDLFSGVLRFVGGEIGALSINWLTPTKVRELSVTGERGLFVVNYLTQELDFYENRAADSHWESFGVLQSVGEGNMTRLHIDRREPLLAELASFANAVATGSAPEVTGEDGLAALALAQAMVRSGETATVCVPEWPEPASKTSPPDHAHA